MPVSRNRQSLIAPDAEFAPALERGMRGYTQTLEAVLMAWLNRNLSFEVKRLEIDPITHELAVQFKNGHTARTTLEKAKTDEFLALCVIIYDLPSP